MNSILNKTRLILLIVVMLVSFSFSQELIKFKENGARDKRINVVIVGDGYLSSQKAYFENHIQDVYDAIVSDPVLSRYANYHNFYGVFRASNQEGADNDDGCNGTIKDTYYESKYCTSNVDRLLTANTTKARNDVTALVPEYDIIMVIVNATRYGGSGGSIAVSSASSPEVVAHEIGHSFPSLKDEYESYYSITPQVGLNITNTTDRASIHWNYWIESSTALPTVEIAANTGIVGAFEGAAYQPTGWYRPEFNCRMRSNGVDLCSICAEIWTLKIHELISPVDEFLPAEPQVVGPQIFSVDPIGITSGSEIDIQWYVDSTEQIEARGQTTWTPNLTPGQYEIWVQVRDTTDYVRQDPSNLMQAANVWQLNLTEDSSTSIVTQVLSTKTSIHADAFGFHWRAQGLTEYRLFNATGELLANFKTTSKSGMTSWPNLLHAGKYYFSISDQSGIHTRNFTIK